MALAIQIILLLLFVKFSSYFLLAAFTNLISPIKSSMLKGKCIGAYMYGTHMVTPWNQIIEVEGNWVIDQDLLGAQRISVWLYQVPSCYSLWRRVNISPNMLI